MPCNGGNYFGRERVVHVTNPEDAKMRRHIDVLVRRLCYACALLADNGIDMGRELDEWHYEHRLKDAERVAEAKRRADAEEASDRRAAYLVATRKRVMGQLTDDERESLGLPKRKKR